MEDIALLELEYEEAKIHIDLTTDGELALYEDDKKLASASYQSSISDEYMVGLLVDLYFEDKLGPALDSDDSKLEPREPKYDWETREGLYRQKPKD